MIGKVYIIHAHDCEINFGCWLQESKCAFLDDDDENGSVQSQNLTMSCTILAVIQVGHCTRCITPRSLEPRTKIIFTIMGMNHVNFSNQDDENGFAQSQNV